MINLYENSKAEELKKSLKLFRVIFYSALALFFGLELTFCLLISYKTRNLYQPLIIGTSIIFAIILCFIFFYFIYPNKWKINRINFVNNSIKHEIEGSVESFGDSKTLRRDVSGKEVIINTKEGSSVYYLEDNELKIEFNKTKKYRFYTNDNFIVSFEEINHEEVKK